MFLELIAVFMAGVAGAGVMLLLIRLSRGRLPRWMVPVAAGAAMLGTTISSEYGWYGRTRDVLPDGLEVIQTAESRALYRPWTYVFPFVDRFVALDTKAVRTNVNQPALHMTHVYFFARWKPIQAVEVMVNCATGERADPGQGDGGAPVWRDVPADDPIVTRLCGEV